MGAFKQMRVGIVEDRERYGYSLKEIAKRNETTVKDVAECLVDYYENQIADVKREYWKEVMNEQT